MYFLFCRYIIGTMYYILSLVFLILYSSNAYAYIDPSSGSAIVAAIVGFFAAIIWNIKKIWYKLKNIITKKKS